MTEERRERITNLFKSGRLLVSDWKIMTDEEKELVFQIGEALQKEEKGGNLK